MQHVGSRAVLIFPSEVPKPLRNFVTNRTATTSQASVTVVCATCYVPVLWMSAVPRCQPRAVRVS